jgi:hypothetical protein
MGPYQVWEALFVLLPAWRGGRDTSVYDGLYEAGSKLKKRLGCRQSVDYKKVGMRGQKDSDCLGSWTGPHTKEVWTSMQLGCATRLSSLVGKATHLCIVYQIVACHSLFWETKGTANAAGKELYLSSNQPVKADGHSFSKSKHPLEEMFTKNCIVE